MNRQFVLLSAQWGVFLGAALLTFSAAPYVVSTNQQRSNITAAKIEAKQETQRLEIQDEALMERSEVAAKRIERGCQRLLQNGEAVLIRPGVQARDGVSGLPVAPGLIFCDHLGNTAISDETGHLIDFAALNRKQETPTDAV